MTTFTDVLHQWQTASPQEKGARFERFVLAFFRQGFYPERFRVVLPWAAWVAQYAPQESGKDRGIDLVAEDTEGRRWAIQAKHWDRPVSWSDLATFVAEAERSALQMDRLLVVAPHGLTRDAWERCQERGIGVYTGDDFARAPVQWDQFRWDQPAVLPRLGPRPLRPYQQEAVARIVAGWQTADRGQCIMPPGTGKTLVALRAMEAVAPPGAVVLFCAPSIALVNQTVLAWQQDATVPLRFVAVTSDRTVGRDADRDRTTALVVPPTTDAATLVQAAQPTPEAVTVVVSTYQSLPVVAEAQRQGLPAFAVAIADEAHRTTGLLAHDEDDPTGFLLFHDGDRLQAARRLYLTATPRVFTESLKTHLKQRGITSVSMDDPAIFGSEFFRYPFWQAVEDGVLARYQVVVLAFSERAVQEAFVQWLQDEHAPTVPQLVRVEGLWKVLHHPLLPTPLRRVIAFVNAVSRSQALAADFAERQRRYPPPATALTYTVRHIDGTMSMAERAQLLRALEEPGEGQGMVLTNARVLTEGIDVPALDAVVFLEPRRSQVEVIQAVGRVMRKPPDRPDKVGYIVVPVVLDAPEGGESLAEAAAHLLPQDERFRPLLQILNALRSLDERADVYIRKLIGDDGLPQPEDDDTVVRVRLDPALPAVLQDQIRMALVTRLVEPVDNRHYFATFQDAIATTARHLRTQLDAVLADPAQAEARQAFDAYRQALRAILHPAIGSDDARDFLVQHWILAPVFGALFPGDDLTAAPVAAAFERVTAAFQAFLERERATLADFYRRTQRRAEGLRSDAERQDFLRQLYENLFKAAFPEAARRLGIVYTPVELVNFLVRSVDVLLDRHFGKTTADAGVTVIDPFAGTGTFPARLLARWEAATIRRKLRDREIWANDVQLFAYYLLLTNLRWTIRQQTGEDPGWHLPVLWVDSFQLQEDVGTFGTTFFADEYTALMAAERDAPITVVIGNPPWRSGQRDENEGNKNLPYMQLDARIRATYAARSTATLKNSLYDAYIRAFRWAADRIGAQGVIGFVTNAGWLDGNAMDGFRKTLADEFTAIYVLNLRGNARTQGDLRRREGAGVFEEGSRAAVALVLLVKDPAHQGPAAIFYHDIGDYLSREAKLARVAAFGDCRAVPWQPITPNAAGDWIQQRSDAFQTFLPLGDKTGAHTPTLFTLYSSGVKTNRDPWVYNFSRTALETTVQRLIDHYNAEVERIQAGATPTRDPAYISWTRELLADARRGKRHDYDPASLRIAMYRPFVKQWLYFHRAFNNTVYLMPRLFPSAHARNCIIVVSGTGAQKAFSCFITEYLPDLELVTKGQGFPLWHYQAENSTLDLFAVAEPEPQAAIGDHALTLFQTHYGDPRITKEDLFYYVYGVLHAPDYRARFANDLKKALPRIPLAPDFWAFSRAGRELADLHLGYETLEPYPLEEVVAANAPTDPWTRYRVTKMRWGQRGPKQPDRTVVIYNEWVTLRGVPPEALQYTVNGRAPLEWVLEEYQVATDKASGIVNDPNAWARETARDPRYILDLVRRVVRVGIETRRIIEALPSALDAAAVEDREVPS